MENNTEKFELVQRQAKALSLIHDDPQGLSEQHT
jgi:hypothetical protein